MTVAIPIVTQMKMDWEVNIYFSKPTFASAYLNWTLKLVQDLYLEIPKRSPIMQILGEGRRKYDLCGSGAGGTLGLFY